MGIIQYIVDICIRSYSNGKLQSIHASSTCSEIFKHIHQPDTANTFHTTMPTRLFFYSLMILLNISGNVSTMVAFRKVPILRQKPSNLFILSLSCADLGVAVVQVMVLPVALGSWSLWSCQLKLFFSTLCTLAGLLSVAAISVDRYLLISRRYPRYVQIQSRRKVICTIGGIWIYSILIGLIDIIVRYTHGYQDIEDSKSNYPQVCPPPPSDSIIFLATNHGLNVVLPVVVIEIMSVYFVILLRRKLRRIGTDITPGNTGRLDIHVKNQQQDGIAIQSAQTSGPSSEPIADHPQHKRYRRAAITLGAIVIGLHICVLPFLTYMILRVICESCRMEGMTIILLNVVYLKSSLNPFLYAATMPKIRHWYRRVFCKRCCCKNRLGVNK